MDPDPNGGSATMHELCFENLVDLDNGKVPVAFNQAVSRVLADCEDRPGEEKARKITLEVLAVPIQDTHGTLDEVQFQFRVSDSVPKRQTKVYPLAFRKKRGKPTAIFSEISNDGSETMFDEE